MKLSPLSYSVVGSFNGGPSGGGHQTDFFFFLFLRVELSAAAFSACRHEKLTYRGRAVRHGRIFKTDPNRNSRAFLGFKRLRNGIKAVHCSLVSLCTCGFPLLEMFQDMAKVKVTAAVK